MIYLRFIIIGALIAILSGEVLISESPILQERIQIQAKPIPNFDLEDAQRCIFGSLKFRGGLELSCPDPEFGGFSALHLQTDGSHFLALSDRAYWLRGRIAYEGKKPSAITDAEIAPVLDPDEKHAARWDTESIDLHGDLLYLGVEGLDQILCYYTDPKNFPVFHKKIFFPPGMKDLPKNQGIEALAFIPGKNSTGGTLAAFSERGLDKNRNLVAYLIEGTDRKTFAVKRSGEYDISDAVLLPQKDLLILERKFNIINGASMRIRQIPVDTIKPDAIVDGPVIVEADMRCQVDNMEAISLHCDASGDIVLTLLSDDNYSSIQRTLLLQFTLMEK